MQRLDEQKDNLLNTSFMTYMFWAAIFRDTPEMKSNLYCHNVDLCNKNKYSLRQMVWGQEGAVYVWSFFAMWYGKAQQICIRNIEGNEL